MLHPETALPSKAPSSVSKPRSFQTLHKQKKAEPSGVFAWTWLGFCARFPSVPYIHGAQAHKIKNYKSSKILAHAAQRRSKLHAALAGLVEGRRTAAMPVRGS